MSYILEALRRAESDRQRGELPGVHTGDPAAAQAPAGADNGRPTGRAGWLVPAAVAALLALGLAAVAWWVWGRAPALAPAPTLATAPAVLPATPPPPVQPPPVPPQTTPPAAWPGPLPAAGGAAAPAPAQAPMPTPTPTPTPTPSPTSAARPVAAEPAGPALPATVTRPGPAVLPEPGAPRVSARPASAQALPPPSAAALPSLAELPAELRQQLPALVLSGAVQSDDPGQRLVFLNGQVLHQGDAVQPGLVVEQIGRRVLVLNFKGQRFTLPH